MESKVGLLVLLGLIKYGSCLLPHWDACTVYKFPEAPYNSSKYVTEWEKRFDYNETLGEYGLFGFRSAVLEFPIPISGNKACLQLEGLQSKYLQIMVEPEEQGPGLCFQEHTGLTEKECWMGTYSGCVTPQADMLKYVFFCEESCQSSPITLHYRFKVSEDNPSEYWCDEQVNDDFPSSLNPSPQVFDWIPEQQYQEREKKVSHGSVLMAAPLLLIAAIFAAMQ